MNHDDGQSHWDLYDADIVLLGVSRTSKSPTSIYLSCRGYKTANIPFVNEKTMPKSIFDLKKPLIVGLIGIDKYLLTPSPLKTLQTLQFESCQTQNKEGTRKTDTAYKVHKIFRDINNRTFKGQCSENGLIRICKAEVNDFVDPVIYTIITYNSDDIQRLIGIKRIYERFIVEEFKSKPRTAIIVSYCTERRHHFSEMPEYMAPEYPVSALKRFISDPSSQLPEIRWDKRQQAIKKYGEEDVVRYLGNEVEDIYYNFEFAAKKQQPLQN